MLEAYETWLIEKVSKSQVEGVTRRELFRLAATYQLITDVDKWIFYHQARNQTSHNYDENVANEVFSAALGFFPYADNLLKALTKKNE